MIKQLFLLISPCFIWLQVAAQSGLDCNSAIQFTGIRTQEHLTSSERWYTFQIDSTGPDTLLLGIFTTEASNGYVDQAELYSGSCSGLTLESTSVRSPGDTLIADTIHVQRGITYYLKLTSYTTPNGPITFDLKVTSVAGALEYILDPNNNYDISSIAPISPAVLFFPTLTVTGYMAKKLFIINRLQSHIHVSRLPFFDIYV